MNSFSEETLDMISRLAVGVLDLAGYIANKSKLCSLRSFVRLDFCFWVCAQIIQLGGFNDGLIELCYNG